MRLALLCGIFICQSLFGLAQDSSFNFDKTSVTLKEVVVRSNLNVSAFIKRVKDDTTFHKAFLNLKILGYTSINDIRMQDKKGVQQASLISRTQQQRNKNCRWTKVLEEKITGDIYDKNKGYNYYTPQMYASIFFAPDTACGENNIVARSSINVEGKTGMAKHKEQLKMLFFNPGRRIPGLPFIGGKVALFDEDVAENYDFEIDMAEFKNEMCYVFKITPIKGKKGIVINEMTTWFNIDTWEITGRNYDLSYNAGVYDFDVHIEVEMTKFDEFLVPKVMRYNGNWDVVFRKRERGIFTATLFDFKK